MLKLQLLLAKTYLYTSQLQLMLPSQNSFRSRHVGQQVTGDPNARLGHGIDGFTQGVSGFTN